MTIEAVTDAHTEALVEFMTGLPEVDRTFIQEDVGNADEVRRLISARVSQWVMVDDDGRIVRVNPAACQMLGYTEEELTRLRVHDIDPAVDAAQWAAHRTNLDTYGGERFETTHRHKDGRLIPGQFVRLQMGQPKTERAMMINERAVGTDPGDVGDTADIEDCNGARHVGRQCRHQRLVEDGNERCPLPARRNVGRAEIVDHWNAGEVGKKLAVADLPGAAFMRRVMDRLAMEADDVDVARLQSGPLKEVEGRHGMALGEDALNFRDLVGWRLAAIETDQPGTKSGVIGFGKGRAETVDMRGVGVDQGGIDPVGAGPAHQSDRPFSRHFLDSQLILR